MNNLRASIDIGSNSILLLIARVENDVVNQIVSESRVTSLGYKLDETQCFHQESMKSSLEALEEYKKLIDLHNVSMRNVVATATEASRVALNASEFYKKVYLKTGIEVKIITADAEAFYSAKGLLVEKSITDKNIFIMDIGGASTEIINLDVTKEKIKDSFSLPMGAVRASDWIEKNVLNSKMDKIFEEFKSNLKLSSTKKLFCVAGTMTSVANMYLNVKDFDEKRIHGFKMSVSDVVRLYEIVKEMDVTEILNKYPFLGKKSKTIIGGLAVAVNIFNELQTTEIEISTYGLRYGTLLEGEIKNEYIA